MNPSKENTLTPEKQRELDQFLDQLEEERIKFEKKESTKLMKKLRKFAIMSLVTLALLTAPLALRADTVKKVGPATQEQVEKFIKAVGGGEFLGDYKVILFKGNAARKVIDRYKSMFGERNIYVFTDLKVILLCFPELEET